MAQKTIAELLEEKKRKDVEEHGMGMGRHFGMEADEFCLEM